MKARGQGIAEGIATGSLRCARPGRTFQRDLELNQVTFKRSARKNLFLKDMANRHVDFLSKEDKVKWLGQRGWTQRGAGFRDPESGITIMFVDAAVERAKKDCRMAADFELALTDSGRNDPEEMKPKQS